MAPPPTPDDIENISMLAKWWQEFLTGVIILASAALLKAKGKKEPVYLVEEDIEQRLTICKQGVMMAVDDIIDEKLKSHKTDLLREIELMIKANR